jgi:hypothetical protein
MVFTQYWTEEEEGMLIKLASNFTDSDIGIVLNRSRNAICKKRIELNLPKCYGYPTKEDHHGWKGGISLDQNSYMRYRRRRTIPKIKEKERARNLAREALYNGTIKKLPCIICGDENVEMHHRDYSKPLEVDFLCKRHHILYHLIERQIEEEER